MITSFLGKKFMVACSKVWIEKTSDYLPKTKELILKMKIMTVLPVALKKLMWKSIM